MKKFKKILALTLSLAMVLGISLTSFADGKSATITVNGAGDGATYNFVQIIKPDTGKTTGWTFVDGYEACFTAQDAFNTDAQSVISQMIKAKAGEETGNNNYTANYAAALNKVFNQVTAGTETENTKTVNDAGVYFIKITETNVEYSPVTAYVSFGTYTGGVPTALVGDTVAAKKKTIEVTKESSDEDNNEVVAIGDTVTFTIRTTVPYIDPSKDTDRTYYIYDQITGAEYQNLSGATIEHAGAPYTATITQGTNDKANTFSINLSDLITPDNKNAGNSIVVTYQAKITGPVINNKAAAGHENEDVTDATFGKGEDDVYTGTITILKYDADPDANKAPLSGAAFEVTKEGETEALRFSGSNGVYEYAPDSADANATQVVTGTDGNLVLKGLNVGTYTLTEKVAPAGYSLAGPKTVTLEVVTAGDDDEITGEEKTVGEGIVKVANKTIFVNDEIGDTRLASLPSTGGIGTTIFTIGGCAIMILAAALYFASRRKAAK